jgi:hypothetical protein
MALCHFFLTESGCKNGETCKFSHEHPKRSTRPHRAKKNYSDFLEFCQVNGEKSNDKYDKEFDTFMKAAALTFYNEHKDDSDNKFAKDTTPAKVAPKKLCDFFFTESGCRKGDDCTFSHVKNTDLVVDNIRTKSTPKTFHAKKLCNFFFTELGCTKGDACRFSHKHITNLDVVTSQTKVLVEAPVEVPVKALVEVPVKAPVEVPVKAPVEVPVKALVEVPVEVPVKALVEVPIEAPVEASKVGSVKKLNIAKTSSKVASKTSSAKKPKAVPVAFELE